MRLSAVSLRNFRCYSDETRISIADLTAIVGRNDVGKSTVLEALEVFFNNSTVKIEPGDCHVRSEDRIVEITCEFEELPQSLILDAKANTSLEAEHLLDANGRLKVKKRYNCALAKVKDEVFVCARHPTAADRNDLLSLTNAALKKRLQDLEISSDGVNLSSNPSIRSAIWGSGEDLQVADVEVPVSKEDGKRIWDKLSEHLPIYALFQSDRASRDSDAEVQDPMKLAVQTALAEPEIQTKLAEVAAAVKTKAVELANRTHEVLSRIDARLASGLIPDFKADPKWAGVFGLSLNSGDGIPVNKRGSGVRRLILVSFFRAEAERRLQEGERANIIYAIEEPETSQHPDNQRMLLESFGDLAAEPGCQVILTTHSPGFANYLPLDSFRFVRELEDGSRTVAGEDEVTWEAMVKTLGIVPDNRVRVLVCVEGPTDVIALERLSAALHSADTSIPDLGSNPGVAFVVLGGGTLSHWVNRRYLEGLGRPECHIYDNDVEKYRKLASQVNQAPDDSWAILTEKREIENYLHPAAIRDGLEVEIEFGDTDDVPELVGGIMGWKAATAKRKLAQDAFPRMTAERIRERDPNAEVEGWFRQIGALL